MAIDSLLTPENQLGNLPLADRAPTSKSDIWNLSLVAGALSSGTGYGAYRLSNIRSDRDAEFKKITGKSVKEAVPHDWSYKPSYFLNPEKMHDDFQMSVDNYITEQRKTNPDFSRIKTDQELRSDIKSDRDFASQEIERNIDGEGLTGSALSMAGYMGGAVAGDPINLASMFVGAGAGSTVLRTVLTETAINAGVEIAQIPSRIKWERSMGNKYGIGNALTDVALAGLGAGAITGLTKGIGHSFKYFDKEKLPSTDAPSASVLDAISRNKSLGSEVRDSALYNSRAAHFDENIPVREPTIKDYTDHANNFMETVRAVKEHRQPNLVDRSGEKAVTVSRSVFGNQLEGQGLSGDNFKRLENRVENNSLVTKQNEFRTRKEADDFVRAQQNRTDYYVQNENGKFSVYERADGEFVKSDNGNKLVYDTKRKANDVAKKLSESTSAKHSLIENGGLFYIIKGDKKLADKISNSDFVAEVKVDKPIIQEVKTPNVPPTNLLYYTKPNNSGRSIDNEFIEANINATNKLDERIKQGDSKDLSPAMEADFNRLIKDFPDEKILIDGVEMKMADLKEIILEDETILDAVKVCAIG